LTLISDEAKAFPDKLNIFIDLGRASTKQITNDRVEATKGEDKSKSDIDWIDAVKNADKLN